MSVPKTLGLFGYFLIFLERIFLERNKNTMPVTVLPPTHHHFNLKEQVIRDVTDFQKELTPPPQRELDALSKRLVEKYQKTSNVGNSTALQLVFILIPAPVNYSAVSAPLVDSKHQKQLQKRKEAKLNKPATSTGAPRGRPSKKVKLLDTKTTATTPLVLPSSQVLLPTSMLPMPNLSAAPAGSAMQPTQPLPPPPPAKACIQPVPFAFGFFFDNKAKAKT